VADPEYMEVVMDSRGSPSLREVPGWDELLAVEQGRGWVVDSVTADHEQAVVRFTRLQ
jgi:hypothetical protein